jgi:hypothetical protein
MASLLETLTSQLGGDTLKKIGSQIGADDNQTKAATGAALSTIIGALARNASKGDGAESLHRAIEKKHDGSVFGNLGSLLQSPESGEGDGILRHVLGGNRQRVERGLSQSTGIQQDSAGKLLKMLAPMVLGALGKQQKTQKMDSRGLSDFLGQQRQQIETQPQSAGVLGKLLDTDGDGDGDVDMGDLAKHGAGLLGKFFGK